MNDERTPSIVIAERRSIGRRFRNLVLESDMTATKFSLALGAMITALGFWTDITCWYAACQFLEAAAPWAVWGALWTGYAALELWRTFDGESRPRIALFVNILGAFLYGGVVIGATIARWPHWSLSGFSIVMALAALWVLARTAINPGYGFRSD